MATIKPIEGRTVHQIQSGQVIVDLCSVVKELVENSLDAGATSIDVRFKNQGLDSIEVQDNGNGISSQNYECVALKHHTSKLSTYSDLATLQTFGFRGEALSSLCALSRFSVITCMAEDAPKGTRLEFEVSGKLKTTSIVAAQKGTTVTVENLFNNLPVRRRELERNIKREWGRVVGVLGQYSCIQTGIKFSVTQQTKGKKSTLFSTKGNKSTRDNIVNVFGAKTLAALVPMDLKLEMESTNAPGPRRSAQGDGEKTEVRIVGHISRPAFGEGRQTPDRQMFFVNARPCGLPQVAKAFNEVYKSYNTSQSPFIFANIELDTRLYDVNVSPDKRTILLHDQTHMLENLKTALTELFESQDYTVPVTSLPIQKLPSYKQLTIGHETARVKNTPKSPSESAEDQELDNDSASSGESSDDEVVAEESHITKSRTTETRASKRDSVAVSLITSWTNRKAQDRADNRTLPLQSADQGTETTPKGKRNLVEKLAMETGQDQVQDNTSQHTQSSAPLSPASDVQPSDTPASPVTISTYVNSSKDKVDRETGPVGLATPIPALQSSSSQLHHHTPNIFSSSARPQRPPAAIATINIGDQTVTSSIGGPCPKKLRTENAPSPKIPLSSFGSKLSQRFAAPGSSHQPESTEEHAEHEDQEKSASPTLLVSPTTQSDEDADIDDKLAEDESPEPILEGNFATSMASLDDTDDGEYIDEDEKKAREEARVQQMIKVTEEAAALPSQQNTMRAKALLKGGALKKDLTVHLVQVLDTSISRINWQLRTLNQTLKACRDASTNKADDEAHDQETAEEKLSLTISKADFAKMKIIGQFNLGFILASRLAEPNPDLDAPSTGDELFIIDQHASDEKYNFERLQATTIVQSQRLVYPKVLDLTALEEEIVIENLSTLETNGFVVAVDQSGNAPVGQRCQLISLPLSRETTFSLTDLEELLALLSEHPPGSIPRPSRVRKMFAMRACRSSIMIGRTLTHMQMGKVIKNMGEIDKPWNCPHGRPTMRHLCRLSVWDELGWMENDGPDGEKAEATDWAGYVRTNRAQSVSPELE